MLLAWELKSNVSLWYIPVMWTDDYLIEILQHFIELLSLPTISLTSKTLKKKSQTPKTDSAIGFYLHNFHFYEGVHGGCFPKFVKWSSLRSFLGVSSWLDWELFTTLSYYLFKALSCIILWFLIRIMLLLLCY